MSTVVVLTSGTTWTVPADWNSSANTIELIGGGGGGGSGSLSGGGQNRPAGGGGKYGKKANVTLTPGASVTYQIGQGGTGGAAASLVDPTNGTDTIFNSGATTVAGTSGSGIAVQGAQGRLGGSTSFGTDSGNNGGNGGTGGPIHGDGGGGGAGGPAGVGKDGGNGADNSGAQGGAGGGGADGGTAGVTPPAGSATVGGANGSGVGKGGDGAANGGAGGAGTNENTWGAGVGPGGGGGGGGGAGGGAGGNGGTGAGGGASGWSSGAGGTGGNGLIAITYTPSAVAPTLSSPAVPAAGATLTATLSQSGCIPTSGTGGFTLAGTLATLTSWAISGTTLTLTLSGVVEKGQTVTYSYDRSTTTDDISDSTGAAFLANFSGTSVTNNSLIPAHPTVLAAGAVTSTTVPLTWTDNADNETGFDVQYDVTNLFSSPTTIHLNTGDTTSDTVMSLAPSTTYYFRVRATNASGNSGWSNTVSATTGAVVSSSGGGMSPAHMMQAWGQW